MTRSPEHRKENPGARTFKAPYSQDPWVQWTGLSRVGFRVNHSEPILPAARKIVSAKPAEPQLEPSLLNDPRLDEMPKAKEVLRRRIGGKTFDEIAHDLGIAKSTACNHMQYLKRKGILSDTAA